MSGRRSSEELRALVVEAGRTVLYNRGLRATASHVPMTEALAELERTHGMTVSMGSIFGRGRLWPSVKEFQIEVLEAVIADQVSGGPNDSSLSLIHELPDMTDQPYAERRDMLIELCRIAGQINGYVREPEKDRTWTLWVATWTIAVTDRENGARLVPRLREGEDTMRSQFSELYEFMMAKLGLRVRAPYQIDDLALLAAAVTDGIALRVGVIPERVAAASNAHSDGDWNMLGLGLMAVALELIEDALDD